MTNTPLVVMQCSNAALSNINPEPQLYCRLGTIDYLAPEILDCPAKEHPDDNKQNPDIGYTSKVDCWSIGVLAYELLVGRAPFAAVRMGRVGKFQLGQASRCPSLKPMWLFGGCNEMKVPILLCEFSCCWKP